MNFTWISEARSGWSPDSLESALALTVSSAAEVALGRPEIKKANIWGEVKGRDTKRPTVNDRYKRLEMKFSLIRFSTVPPA